MTDIYPFRVPVDEFKDKRVLVTGGTKGIGEAIVRRFTLGGALVATTARSPLPQDHSPAVFVQADIGTAAGAQAVIDRIQQEWNGLDILINSAGGSDAPNGGFQVLSDRDWQTALGLNLLAAVRLDRAFLPGMIERKSGIVLHISSIQHRLPHYDATRSLTLQPRQRFEPIARVLRTRSDKRESASIRSRLGSSKLQAHAA